MAPSAQHRIERVVVNGRLSSALDTSLDADLMLVTDGWAVLRN